MTDTHAHASHPKAIARLKRANGHLRAVIEMIENGQELPDYFKEYPVYYAGPAKKPDGMPSGSFGPTTAAAVRVEIVSSQLGAPEKLAT